MRLAYKGCTVSKEKDILCPARSKQHIRERNGNTGFTGTGCHNKQSVTAILSKRITGIGDGLLLIITTGDVIVDLRRSNILAGRSAQLQELQFFDGMELEYTARLIAQLVNNVYMISVGIVSNGLISVFSRHLVSFFDGLGSTFNKIFGGSRVFNNSKGTVVSSVKNVVYRIAVVEDHIDTGSTGHSLVRLINHRPTSLTQGGSEIQFLVFFLVSAMMNLKLSSTHTRSEFCNQFRSNNNLLLRLNCLSLCRPRCYGFCSGSTCRLNVCRIVLYKANKHRKFTDDKVKLLQHI